jgi:hypothetical protein
LEAYSGISPEASLLQLHHHTVQDS